MAVFKPKPSAVEAIFGTRRGAGRGAGRGVVVGVIHSWALPGSPGYDGMGMDELVGFAVAEAERYRAGGVDGLIVENHGDIPFSKPEDLGPETAACMAVMTDAVRRASGLPVGVNVLANAPLQALAVAKASGAAFIRVNQWANAYVANEGFMEGRAGEAARYRANLRAREVRIFADVHVKHGGARDHGGPDGRGAGAGQRVLRRGRGDRDRAADGGCGDAGGAADDRRGDEPAGDGGLGRDAGERGGHPVGGAGCDRGELAEAGRGLVEPGGSGAAGGVHGGGGAGVAGMAGRVHVVGNCMMDVRVALPHLPRPGETLIGAGGERAPGGKAVNQAVAAARAGARVRLLAPVGVDGAAAEARAALGRERLEELVTPAFPFANDFAMLLVMPGGENATVGTVNCARALDPGAAAAFTGMARPGDRVLVQGNLRLDTTLAAVGAAPPGSVVFNPSPVVWDAAGVLAASGTVVANEIEAQLLTGEAEPGAGALALARMGVGTVVVTVGARGCFTVRDGALRHWPAVAVATTDTSGCGDVFCGVFAAGLAAGETLERAVGRAQAAAAITAVRPGAFAAIPAAGEMPA